MCGIAGIFSMNGQDLAPESSDTVRRMTDAMKYRGPDDSGIWRTGQACFGHRRLSIIDITGGSQPMLSTDKNACIVFNGEIYNYRELRRELEGLGHTFHTDSDTEVLLESYIQWGCECLTRFDGMFAFALWDKRNQKLFCARDIFGKKPFFYSQQNGNFYFASELAALGSVAVHGSLSFHIDRHQVMRYLAYEYVPAPATIYKEAFCLEPAHYMVVQDGNIISHRYWDMPVPEEYAQKCDDALCEELRYLMKESVRRRMISDVPLGVFLSGGIDSSIVTGLMASLSSKPVKTFSIGFSEASYDESGYATIVAAAFKTEHHERILSSAECADILPDIVSRMDVPMADASVAPTWLLSALSREHVTVALGGDGADELWAGYEHYIGFKLCLFYNKLPKFVRDKIVRPIADHLPSSSGYINPRLAAMAFLNGANAPDWLRVQSMLTAFSPEMLGSLLEPEWLQAQDGAAFLEEKNIFEPTRIQFEHWTGRIPPLARAFHVYIRQFLLDDILVKVDRCSMLHSLEVRAPFLDKKVAEFAARLPIPYKLHGFRRKYLLKKAFAKLLPPEILKRNKRGFQIPVAQWLRGRMRPLMQDLLSRESLKAQGIFNASAVENMMKVHMDGKADMRKQLWTLIVFQLWWNANRHIFGT